MNLKFILALIALSVMVGLPGTANRLHAQASVSLTVSDQQMQPIIGLGFSIHRAKPSYVPTNTANFERLYDTSFDGFNSMVFWSYIENPVERDQMIAAAQASGLQHIIVNTTGEPETPEEHAQLLFMEIHEYMVAGYPIYGTTVMNKPNTDESDTRRVDPTFLTVSAKLLRAKLDSAGYTDIKIGGPSTVEWAPYMDPTTGGASHGYSFVPGDNMAYLQAFLDDPAALAVLDAFDFQSYGWSMRDTVRQLAALHGKEQWVTLAALDGKNNQNGQPILATAIAANLLANINHGVGSWNHWVWDQFFNLTTYQPNLRFRYLQAIGQHFEAGAIVRRVVADHTQPTASMAWNYYDMQTPANNLQPDIVAAAALNPDSSLSIGVVNLSGIQAQHFLSEYFPNDAENYAVNLQIEELINVPSLTAYPQICKNDGQFSQEPPVTILNGQVSLVLNSKDMVLLRTDPLPSMVTSLDPAATIAALRVFPNPAKDQIQVMLPEAHTGNVLLQCFDLQGRRVASWQQQVLPGQEKLTWQLPAQLTQGLYVLQMQGENRAGQRWQQQTKLRVNP